MHYYAFYNHYGNNTTDTDGNRIGTLYVFDTKRERDEWNDDEDYRDGNLHREAISSKEARRMLSTRRKHSLSTMTSESR